MRINDKKAMVIVLLFILAIGYYFLFPRYNWLGKSYLDTSEKEGFAVVELFTSEGCSSCPPADALMAQAQKEAGEKKIYFLAYHVDYWDHQGWKDRFSSDKFTKRQEQYAVRMDSRLIYTPQFIINGKDEFEGDDARTLYSHISDALQETPEFTLAMMADIKPNSITVKYTTNNIAENTSLLVAIVKKNDSTRVGRGENSGHFLNHVQIVWDAYSISLNNKQGSMEILMPIGFNIKEWELIGLIQNDITGVISAASKADF